MPKGPRPPNSEAPMWHQSLGAAKRWRKQPRRHVASLLTAQGPQILSCCPPFTFPSEADWPLYLSDLTSSTTLSLAHCFSHNRSSLLFKQSGSLLPQELCTSCSLCLDLSTWLSPSSPLDLHSNVTFLVMPSNYLRLQLSSIYTKAGIPVLFITVSCAWNSTWHK